MMYPKKIVKLPADFIVGSEIGIIGEGDDIFTVTGIDKDSNGNVVDVHNSSGWSEPLCKMYLLRSRYHSEARKDPTSWIDVAIGECDKCGKKFPDACAYYNEGDKIFCASCK